MKVETFLAGEPLDLGGETIFDEQTGNFLLLGGGVIKGISRMIVPDASRSEDVVALQLGDIDKRLLFHNHCVDDVLGGLIAKDAGGIGSGGSDLLVLDEFLRGGVGQGVAGVETVKHQREHIEASVAGVGIGITKDDIAGKGGLDDVVDGDFAIFGGEGVVNFALHEDAGGIASDAVGQLDDAETSGFQHQAGRIGRGEIKDGTVIGFDHIGDGFTRGNTADTDADSLAIDLEMLVVEIAGDDVDKIVGGVARQLGRNGNLNIEVTVTFDGFLESVDAGQGLEVGSVHIEVGLRFDGGLVDLLNLGLELGDGFVVGIGLAGSVVVAGRAAGTETEEQSKDKGSETMQVFHLGILLDK